MFHLSILVMVSETKQKSYFQEDYAQTDSLTVQLLGMLTEHGTQPKKLKQTEKRYILCAMKF